MSNHPALQRATSWNSFFQLLTHDDGPRLRLGIPDTVLLRFGTPLAWLYTDRDGHVRKQPAARTTLEEAARHFARCSPEFETPWVCIARQGDGEPRLVGREALASLLHAAADPDRLPGAALPGAPSILQAAPIPRLDARYVATYENDGRQATVTTYARRYSRRYLPLDEPWWERAAGGGKAAGGGGRGAGGAKAALVGARDAGGARERDGPPGAGGHSAAEAASGPVYGSGRPGGGGEGSIAAFRPAAGDGSAAALRNDAGPGAPARPPGQAAPGSAAALVPTPAPLTASHPEATPPSPRDLPDGDRWGGDVDPGLRSGLRRELQRVVRYVQRAHNATLRTLSAEFVRGQSDNLLLMSILHAEWAAPGGTGGTVEPYASANLMDARERSEPARGAGAGAQPAAPASAAAAAVVAAAGRAEGPPPTQALQARLRPRFLPPLPPPGQAIGRPSDPAGRATAVTEGPAPRSRPVLYPPAPPGCEEEYDLCWPGLEPPEPWFPPGGAGTGAEPATFTCPRGRSRRARRAPLATRTSASPATLLRDLQDAQEELREAAEGRGRAEAALASAEARLAETLGETLARERELRVRADDAEAARARAEARLEESERDEASAAGKLRGVTAGAEALRVELEEVRRVATSEISGLRTRLVQAEARGGSLEAELGGARAALAAAREVASSARARAKHLEAALADARAVALDGDGSDAGADEDGDAFVGRGPVEETRGESAASPTGSPRSDGVPAAPGEAAGAAAEGGLAAPREAREAGVGVEAAAGGVGAGMEATTGGTGAGAGAATLSPAGRLVPASSPAEAEAPRPSPSTSPPRPAPASPAHVPSLQPVSRRFRRALRVVRSRIAREADIDGERYAVAKELCGRERDLRAVFLHYCLRDPAFASRWPPALARPGWDAFVADAWPVSGLKARAARVRESGEAFAELLAVLDGTGVAVLPPVGARPPPPGWQPPAPAAEPFPVISVARAAPLEIKPGGASAPTGAGPPADPDPERRRLDFQTFCAGIVVLASRFAAEEGSPRFLSDCLRDTLEAIVARAQKVQPLLPGPPAPAKGRRGGSPARRADLSPPRRGLDRI